MATAIKTARRGILALVITALLPAAAQAHTPLSIDRVGGTLSVIATNEPAEGLNQDVVLDIAAGDPGRIRFRDLTGEAGRDTGVATQYCQIVVHNEDIRCPFKTSSGAPLFTRILVSGKDGDDIEVVAPNVLVPATLNAGNGNDKVFGGGGPDTLNGDPGDDLLDGGPNTDGIFGKTGTDTVSYATRTANVTVDLAKTTGAGASGENDRIYTVENVQTGAGDDSIRVRNGKTNAVSCGGGKDRVVADPLSVDLIATNCEKRPAPAARLGGKGRQKLGRFVSITVACLDAKCIATATGRMGVPPVSASKVYKLKKAKKSIRKGRKAKLKLKLSRKARNAARRALRAGKRVSVKIKVVVRDKSGNKRTLRRKVRLRG